MSVRLRGQTTSSCGKPDWDTNLNVGCFNTPASQGSGWGGNDGITVLHLFPFATAGHLGGNFELLARLGGRRYLSWENKDAKKAHFKKTINWEGRRVLPGTNEYVGWAQAHLPQLWGQNWLAAFSVATDQDTEVDVEWVRSALQARKLASIV